MRIFRLHRIFIAQSLKRLLEYRADFIVGTFSYFFMQGCTLVFIWVVFSNVNALAGFSNYEVLFIYGFSLIPKALDNLFFDNFWEVSYRIIRKGEFDRYLTRPINPLLQVMMEQFNVDALGELAMAGALIVISVNHLPLRWTAAKIALSLAVMPFATAIYAAIKILGTAVSFWAKQSGNVLFMFYMINDFAKYPVGIYNRLIRIVITYIVPFALTAYFPAEYILRGTNPLFNIGMPAVVSAALLGIAIFIWNMGLSAYESSGS